MAVWYWFHPWYHSNIVLECPGWASATIFEEWKCEDWRRKIQCAHYLWENWQVPWKAKSSSTISSAARRQRRLVH